MKPLLRRIPFLGRRFAEDIEPPTEWTGPEGGRRVLIEEDDAELRKAMAESLREAGFQTAECAGPGSHGGRRCPLVGGEGCGAVDGADAVLQVFVPRDEAMHEVRAAIHAHDPDKLISVMTPALTAARHPDLLEGADVSPLPLTRRGVVTAVDEVLDG
jgi:hypothetical protein